MKENQNARLILGRSGIEVLSLSLSLSLFFLSLPLSLSLSLALSLSPVLVRGLSPCLESYKI